jgi:hypothetical protein
MWKSYAVDVLGLSAICFWVGISIYYWSDGEALLFQRQGALGTAVAAVYFAFVIHSLPYPVGLRERLSIFNDQMNFQAEATRVALNNTTILAANLKKSLEQNNQTVPASVAALSAQTLFEHAAKSGPLPLEQWELRGAELLGQGVSHDSEVVRVAFLSGVFQAAVVVVSTLQWGFGDWAVNFFMLCGKITC